MKKGQKFWQLRNATDDPNIGELLLYGIIGDWLFDDVKPKQFKEELDALGDVDEIRVYINSDGGDVFAGQAIYSMLKRHKARVVVYIDGLAASIASVVAMAGDVVYMPKNAMMMIHNPWTIGMGDANEFRELAEVLDKVRESIIVVYQEKTGLGRDEIIELLDAETWMTAEEAVEKGFADEVEETKQIAAALRGSQLEINGRQFDLSRFRNLPPIEPEPEPEPEPRQDDPDQGPGEPEATADEKRGDPAFSNDSPLPQRQVPLSLYEYRLRINERSVC